MPRVKKVLKVRIDFARLAREARLAGVDSQFLFTLHKVINVEVVLQNVIEIYQSMYVFEFHIHCVPTLEHTGFA